MLVAPVPLPSTPPAFLCKEVAGEPVLPHHFSPRVLGLLRDSLSSPLISSDGHLVGAPAQVAVLNIVSQPLHLLLCLCRVLPACWDGCGLFLINAQQVLLEEPSTK